MANSESRRPLRFFRELSASHRRFLGWLIPVLGVAGICVGYSAGLLISVNYAKTGLQSYSEQLLDRSDAASLEAREVLASMKTTRAPYCSHQELDNFGLLLFRSRYLRDIGHMRGGKINCSSILGPLESPIEASQPDFVEPGGASLYSVIPVFKSRGLNSITLQLDDEYVTFSPNVMASVEDPLYHYALTAIQPLNRGPGQLMGNLPLLPLEAFSTTNQGREADLLYSTSCSAHYFICATAYTSVPEVIHAGRRHAFDSGVTGAFAGIGLAFLLALIRERRSRIDKQFRRALRKGGLNVLYQPVVDLRTRRTVGAEALARWTDKRGNVIGPNVFIPMAEKMGLAKDLTRIVLRTVLEDLAEIANGEPGFRVGFNVSADEVVDTRLMPLLRRELSRHGVSPNSLAIEITEGSTANHAELGKAIHVLRKFGLLVYLDDFGTGYSSLSYLNDLSVDVIKIDRAFTLAIGTDSVTACILPQILEMAGKLALRVIVEGVETEQQADFLAIFKYPILAQGWRFGRPMPAWMLKERLKDEAQQLSLLEPLADEDVCQ